MRKWHVTPKLGLILLTMVGCSRDTELKPWRQLYEYSEPPRQSIHAMGNGPANLIEVERIDGDQASRTLLDRNTLRPVAQRTGSKFALERWSPDHRYLAEEAMLEPRVTVLDTASWGSTASWSGYAFVTWSSDSEHVVLLQASTKEYWLADLRSPNKLGRLEWPVDRQLTALQVDVAGSRALLAIESEIVDVDLFTGEGRVIATDVHGLTVAPKADLVLVQHSTDLALLDVNHGSEMPLGYGKLGADLRQVGAWSPDGRWHAAFAADPCQLVLTDRKGRTQTWAPARHCQVNFAARPGPVSWSADGQRVFVVFNVGEVNPDRGYIGMYDVASGKGRTYRLPSPYLSWWPDGSGFFLWRSGQPNRYEDYRLPST